MIINVTIETVLSQVYSKCHTLLLHQYRRNCEKECRGVARNSSRGVLNVCDCHWIQVRHYELEQLY